MSWKRRLFIFKSRPQPILAAGGLALELVIFLPLVGPGPGSPPEVPFLGAVGSVVFGHALAALVTGLAFPGWVGSRGSEWFVPPDPSGSPAKALVETPPVRFYVREAEGRVEETAAPAPRGGGGSDERRSEHRLGPLSAAISLAFPVLGPATVLVIAAIRRYASPSYDRIIREYREMVDTQFTVADLPPDVRGAVVERTWQALELRPFVEILGHQGEDSDVTISAIESVSNLDVTQASRLLRHALSSPTPEARYSAAKALTRIEESLDVELQKAQDLHRLRPESPGPMMRIADARFSYGEIGDADDPLTLFHYAEAIRFYDLCLDRISEVERAECQARLATACLRIGSIELAKRHYMDLVDRGARALSVLRGCVEACYRDHDYHGLRRYLRIGLDRAPDSDVLKEVARTWLLPGEMPT